MKFRKFIATLLVGAMATTTLIGCSSSSSNSTTSDSGTVSSASEEYTGILTPTGTYPIVKEGEELEMSVFMSLRTSISSYSSDINAMTAWVEDMTGMTFKFTSPSDSDVQVTRNTMMTSLEYPEILMTAPAAPLSASEQLLYGQQGILLPLNDLIDEHMPNLKAILEDEPHILQNFIMEDGNIYSLPQIAYTVHSSVPMRMWINQEWLDNLGLPLPTTTDEFYDTLVAFRDLDANGNGNPNDEVPLSGSSNGWNTNPLIFLANAFLPYSTSSKFMYVDDDGQIHYSRTQDEFRDALAYLNKLYSEGLLDNLAYSQLNDELKRLGDNPGDALLGAAPGGSLATLMNLGDSDRWLQYTTVAPLVGPEGFQQAMLVPVWGTAAASITNKCENPEAAARFLDLLYTEDAFLAAVIVRQSSTFKCSDTFT